MMFMILLCLWIISFIFTLQSPPDCFFSLDSGAFLATAALFTPGSESSPDWWRNSVDHCML